MKFSQFAFLSVSFGAAAAFVPGTSSRPATAMCSEVAPSEEPVAISSRSSTTLPEVAFGWIPDSSKPCYGLPGAIEPLGFFDPLELTKEADLNTIKRYREAEIMHGRIAMMATVGYLIAENTPTIMYNSLPTIANNQLAEMPSSLLLPLFLFINFAEAWRAINGWVTPSEDTLFQLKENYYPGGIGFDPMDFAPKDAKDFASMTEKELSNGRLAMIGVAGMCVQELVTGQPLFN